jgi:hypothetical protein
MAATYRRIRRRHGNDDTGRRGQDELKQLIRVTEECLDLGDRAVLAE